MWGLSNVDTDLFGACLLMVKSVFIDGLFNEKGSPFNILVNSS